MNGKQVVLNNSKSNSVKNLNTANSQNEAKRLQEKVNSYRTSKNLNNNMNSSTINNSVANNNYNSSMSTLNKTTNGSKNNNSNSNSNSQVTNELASAGLSAVGVPKPLSDAVVNSELGQKAISVAKKKNFALNMLDKLTGGGKKETEESYSGGEGSVSGSFNIVKIGLALCAILSPIVIFACLFMVSTQVYIKSIGLGDADSLSSEGAEEKINKKSKDEDNLNTEVNDIGMDFFIEDVNSNSFRSNKLKESNLVQIASTNYLKRKYNESDLDNIEDFYPSIMNITKDEDINLVYDFYFKMYNLYIKYRDTYKTEKGTPLYLDLPLLMSTLSVQSDDMREIFNSNLTDDDKKKTARTSYDEFDYNNNLSWYVPTATNSTYDMAVLAQNMISKQVKEMCKNSSGKEVKTNILKDEQIGTQVLVCGEGETYETSDEYFVVDNDKYRNYLKEFLMKKYSLSETAAYDMIVEIYDMKEQYEYFAGEYEESTVTIHQATSTSYWWPIGSSETTEVNGKIFATGDPQVIYVTSPFGYRKDPFGRGTTVFHSGLDIAGGSPGQVNIIAARDGIVVYPTTNVSNTCPSSNSLSSCGGGYGNYVIIQHSDGNYTLYAHMYQNSITVKAGDSVQQGQVIGKMGSSGNSTGNHLHFEVREGINSSKAAVDPLNYISAENPREVFTGDEFLAWLNSWEGHSPIEGDYYIVEDIGDGVRTVGGGVTLEFNADNFATYGINIDDYPVGSKIPISIVDQIQLEEVASKRSYIENVLSNNSITLEEYEIQALVSQMYNIGNINGFVDAYQTYGNTKEFYDKWFFRAIAKGSQFEVGLTRRRNSEWSLFHLSEYVYNG